MKIVQIVQVIVAEEAAEEELVTITVLAKQANAPLDVLVIVVLFSVVELKVVTQVSEKIRLLVVRIVRLLHHRHHHLLVLKIFVESFLVPG